MFKRLIALLICFTFSLSNLQYVHAQDFSINQLPVPGTMVGISSPFAPLALKGLIVNPQKPLEFQFIVDTGRGPQDTASVKEQANQLVKYFLAGLTIPEGDLWVNLSPYEKNRMVPEALGQTDLGRDLLAQDYILKQLTASLIYPEKDLGKEFWSRVYAKAQQQFGTTNVPVNTFNKVWILPDQAQVYENGNASYITKSTLKVMLDEDYLALQKNGRVNNTHSIASQIVREIVIPEITKEVNTGKNFAPLRQIYQAMILAKWYKETIQNGLLDALYTNKNKVAGVNLNDPTVKEQIYERYLKAYKKGAFNYIKEDPTPDGQIVPRKYFSGGTLLVIPYLDPRGTPAMISSSIRGLLLALTISLSAFMPAGSVNAQTLSGGELQQNVFGRVTNIQRSVKQRDVKRSLNKLKHVWNDRFKYDDILKNRNEIMNELVSYDQPAVPIIIKDLQNTLSLKQQGADEYSYENALFEILGRIGGTEAITFLQTLASTQEEAQKAQRNLHVVHWIDTNNKEIIIGNSFNEKLAALNQYDATHKRSLKYGEDENTIIAKTASAEVVSLILDLRNGAVRGDKKIFVYNKVVKLGEEAKPAIPELLKNSRDFDEIYGNMLEAIGAPNKESLPTLIKLLEGNNETVKLEALHVISQVAQEGIDVKDIHQYQVIIPELNRIMKTDYVGRLNRGLLPGLNFAEKYLPIFSWFSGTTPGAIGLGVGNPYTHAENKMADLEFFNRQIHNNAADLLHRIEAAGAKDQAMLGHPMLRKLATGALATTLLAGTVANQASAQNNNQPQALSKITAQSGNLNYFESGRLYEEIVSRFLNGTVVYQWLEQKGYMISTADVGGRIPLRSLFGLGPDLSKISDKLIKRGILYFPPGQNAVGTVVVVLNVNLEKNKERIRKIAGDHFDEIYTILKTAGGERFEGDFNKIQNDFEKDPIPSIDFKTLRAVLSNQTPEDYAKKVAIHKEVLEWLKHFGGFNFPSLVGADLNFEILTLRDALKKTFHPQEQYSIIEALGNIGPAVKEIVPDLILLLKHNYHPQIEILSKESPGPIAAQLNQVFDAIRESEAREYVVQAAAARALVKIQASPEVIVPVFCEILNTSGDIDKKFFESDFLNGGEIFHWLMTNDFFYEKEGTVVHPQPLSLSSNGKLWAKYPHDAKKVLDILQNILDYNYSVNIAIEDALLGFGSDALPYLKKNSENNPRIQANINRIIEIIEKDNKPQTLMQAAENGNAKAVEQMLANGADINAKDGEGMTALMFASWKSHRIVVEQLLRTKGIDINAKDNDGNTALSLVEHNSGNQDILGILIKYGAKDQAMLGPMHSFTVINNPSDAEISHILDIFGIKDVQSVTSLQGGVASQFKPRLIQSRDGQWVLRQTHIPIDQMKFIISVMNHLYQQGLPVPVLKARADTNANGAEIFLYGSDRTWYTLESYLTKGQTIKLENTTISQFESIARLAAQINNALIDFKPEGEKGYLSPPEILAMVEKSLKNFTSQGKSNESEAYQIFVDNYGFIMNQIESFKQNFNAHGLRPGIIHGDLHPGNVKFDEQGVVVSLFDADYFHLGLRIWEFNNLVMGKDAIAKNIPYTKQKLEAVVLAYNKAVKVKLSKEELRAIIEVIRLRFLQEIDSRFVTHHEIFPLNVFDHTDQLPFAQESIRLFKQFNQDFSSEQDIDNFVTKMSVESDSAMQADMAMKSNNKKILLSKIFSGLNDSDIAIGIVSGSISFLILGIVIGGISYSSNDAFKEFVNSLTRDSYEIFKLALRNPDTYKITAAGIGFSTALLVWQNYSLRGLLSLFKKGSNSDEEIIRRIKNKGKKVVPVLLELLGVHSSLTGDIISALGDLGDSQAIGPIADVLGKGENFELANKVLQQLGADRETIFQANLKALNTATERAIKFLGNFGDKRAIGPIAEILGNNGGYSELANEAFQNLGANREIIFQANLKILTTNNDHYSYIEKAIEFLGNFGDKRAIGPISDILSSREYYFEIANEALRKLGAEHETIFQANMKALSILPSYGTNEEAMIKFLGGLGDKRAIKSLSNRFSSSTNYSIRKVIVTVIKDLGGQDAIKQVAESLAPGLLNAEEKNQYDRYNEISQRLYELGDPRGDIVYTHVYPKWVVTSPEEGHSETYEGQYGGTWWIVDKPEEGYNEGTEHWEKGPRTNAAMIANVQTQGGWRVYTNNSSAIPDKAIHSALKKGAVGLDLIIDSRLREFLAFLHSHGLDDVVIIGGAVRDAIRGSHVHDIDITAQVDMPADEIGGNKVNFTKASRSTYEQAEKIAVRLADAMGVTVDQLRKAGNSVKFKGLNVQYFGPISIPKETGESVYIKNVVVDKNTGTVEASMILPEILMVGMSPDGKLLGYKEALTHWLNGYALLKGAVRNGRNFPELSMLKLMRLRHEFGMNISENTYELMKRTLAEKREDTVSPPELVDEEIQKLLSVAIDQKLARQELKELGFNVPNSAMSVQPDRDGAYDGEVVGNYRWIPAVNKGSIIPGTERWEEGYGSTGTLEKTGEYEQYGIPAHWEIIDSAMLGTPKVISKANPLENGGIDLNQINVLRNGKTVNVQFDPAQLNQLMQGGFEGFTPVIINITRISSPFQLLGIKSHPKTELLAKA